MIRLFIGDDLRAGGEIVLGADQAHYLLRVMRLNVGAMLGVFNGRDGEWRATVTAAGKGACALRVEKALRPQPVALDLDLIVAVVKRGRLEAIVEKAAELGVRRVRPVLTQRTNAGSANLTRLNAIATEAAEQTGRLDVPEVCPPQALQSVLANWEVGRRLVFCDEAGDAAPALAALGKLATRNGAWAILIGPEGGFSPAERALARCLPGALPVSLGPRILRADTAAIAAMTLWQATLGDWSGP